MLLESVALAGQLAGAPIEWDAPSPPCPAVAEVEAAVRRLAGRLPDADEIEARATVSRAGERWRLQLDTTVDGVAQQRTLEADSCDALAKATAIVIAVAVDPIVAVHEVRRAETSATPVPVVVEPTAKPIVERDATAPPSSVAEPAPAVTRSRRRVRVHLGVGGGMALGATPAVTGGPAATAGISVGRLRVEVRGAWWAPRIARRGDLTARIQLGTIAAVVCGEPGTSRATFPICGGIETGAMRAAGLEVDKASVQHFGWAAALVGAGVRGWVRPRVGVRADIEVAIPLAIYRVVVGPPSVPDPIILHQSPAVGARAVVGVEFRLR